MVIEYIYTLAPAPLADFSQIVYRHVFASIISLVFAFETKRVCLSNDNVAVAWDPTFFNTFIIPYYLRPTRVIFGTSRDKTLYHNVFQTSSILESDEYYPHRSDVNKFSGKELNFALKIFVNWWVIIIFIVFVLIFLIFPLAALAFDNVKPRKKGRQCKKKKKIYFLFLLVK